jgi:hypothetical protein
MCCIGMDRDISGNHRDALNSALPCRHCWRKWAAEPERLSGQVWGRKIPGPVRRSSARKRGISRHGAAVSLLRQRELAWIVPKILPPASRSQDSWIRLVLPPQSSQAFQASAPRPAWRAYNLRPRLAALRSALEAARRTKLCPSNSRRSEAGAEPAYDGTWRPPAGTATSSNLFERSSSAARISGPRMAWP